MVVEADALDDEERYKLSRVFVELQSLDLQQAEQVLVALNYDASFVSLSNNGLISSHTVYFLRELIIIRPLENWGEPTTVTFLRTGLGVRLERRMLGLIV